MDTHKKWWTTVHKEQFAGSFLEMLSPVYGLFGGGYLPGSAIFRGQGDQWALLPRAFRNDASLRIKALKYQAPLTTMGMQIRAELGTLVEFMNAADRQGQKIPEDSQFLRRSVEALDDAMGPLGCNAIAEWPIPSLLSALGLAQHYQIPTRMMDWTLDPYIAAYFAAKDAAGRKDKDGELSVWMLLHEYVAIETMFSDGGLEHNKLPIQVVRAPYAENANLRAQRGIFLVYRQFNIKQDAPFAANSYDNILVENLAFFKDIKAPIMCNCTLPQSEAPELLRLLALQGVDASSVFPDISGAAESVRELNLWPAQQHRDPRPERYVDAFQRLFG